MHLRPTFRNYLVCSLVILGCSTTRVPASPPVNQTSFPSRIDALRDQLSSPEIAAILNRANLVATSPVLVRARSIEHMATAARPGSAGERTVDTRNKADGIRGRRPADAEQFALACSDMSASRVMLEELPLLAAASRLVSEKPIREHLRRQLREIVKWTPFQRPGWTLGARQNALPPSGDGVWLATGTLLQTLALTLDILPPCEIPADLLAAIRQRMAEEITLTVNDWKAAIPWYVKREASGSNQWIVPASGMVIGAAALGREQFPEAWELGVNSLRRSLSLASEDGSLNEGYAYATGWSGFSFLLANHFMNAAGDTTFNRMPFFQNFPGWVALRFQPGGNSVNSFDNFGGQRGNPPADELTNLAAVAGNPLLTRLVHEETGGRFRSNFFGLLACGELALAGNASNPAPQSPLAELPSSGLFQRSHMFIWRQSWSPAASGFWIRGGDVHDMHNHQDRGHVNLIVSGTPVLIESGTPGYASKRKRPDYDSTFGHNVLTLDGNPFPPPAPAPITVARQDADGGDLSVNLQKVYPMLSIASRRAIWTTKTLQVTDTIATPDGAAAVSPDWRWHLASAEPARIEPLAPNHYRIKIPSGRIVFPAWIGAWSDPDRPRPQGDDIFETAAIAIEITADAPVSVEATTHPDHTLKFRRTENPHTTLIVRSPNPVGQLSVTTTFNVTAPGARQ
jgi:hypothetical protein